MAYVYQERYVVQGQSSYPDMYASQPPVNPGAGAPGYPGYPPPYSTYPIQTQPPNILIATVLPNQDLINKRRRQQRVACLVLASVTFIATICVLRFMADAHRH